MKTNLPPEVQQFLEDITMMREPLNSIVNYRDKQSRKDMADILRKKAFDLLNQSRVTIKE